MVLLVCGGICEEVFGWPGQIFLLFSFWNFLLAFFGFWWNSVFSLRIQFTLVLISNPFYVFVQLYGVTLGGQPWRDNL